MVTVRPSIDVITTFSAGAWGHATVFILIDMLFYLNMPIFFRFLKRHFSLSYIKFLNYRFTFNTICPKQKKLVTSSSMPRFSVTFILARCFPLFNYHNFCFININIKLHVFDTLNDRYITCILLNNQGMKEQTDWLVFLDLELELEQRPVYATGQGTALLALRVFPCVVSQ